MILGQVDMVPNTITKEDFQKKYFKPQKPVLIKGLAEQWSAFDKWNFSYIREKAGEQTVPVYDNKPADASKSSDAPAAKMKMKDYIDTITAGPSDLRIFFYIITDKLPELLHNFSYPELGIKFFKRIPTLFFGGSEARVLMHYDVDLGDFLHFHFEGRKRILLFDQSQSAYLYRVPLSVHTIEDIDYENPDFEKYPGLKYAKGFEVLMEHGDALFIPGGWWHFNTYIGPGFSLSLRALPNKPGRFLNMLYQVFPMRYADKLMRKILKAKWVEYKKQWALKRSSRAIKRAKHA